MDFKTFLKSYDYKLPRELVALVPASPRDSARLLVYRRHSKKIEFATFRNLQTYLPKGAVLVFNETKVLPARFAVRKTTGGKIKLLYLNHHGGRVNVLCERRLEPGARLFVSERKFLTVLNKTGSVYSLTPSFSFTELKKILKVKGETPIPPYLRHTSLNNSQLRKVYQTVFAKSEGSAAAPTASLHFTKLLLKKLRVAGLSSQFVTLHVGLGTFAPLSEQAITTGKLHQEEYSISKNTAAFLNQAKKSGRPIVAVGTTVARTLESACVGGKLKKLKGATQLFIREGYRFKFCDGLITNFHVPKSSLLMLVAALVGRKKLLHIYRTAIKNNFRFFSFGDGMLICG
ncbi:MAG: tRNA preQ1(34) S-adenosylmethionine ribosyltransferase-isomerase QueA [bacterium]|nr:tRNA preQ1(34) S-adenosylmethionine ribosyltransferase-isomerase QueA [bacterium]